MYLINIHILLYHAVKTIFEYLNWLWRYRSLKSVCAQPCHPKGLILAIFNQVGHKSKISPVHRNFGKGWDIRTLFDFQASVIKFNANLAREKSIIRTVFFFFKGELYYYSIHALGSGLMAILGRGTPVLNPPCSTILLQNTCMLYMFVML